ncbi:MAG: 1-acyl-sn-glycerol-3-phosphate acyltransferase [Firmicutes bacterium HGW-Firmicutes-8]|nr:MAG: 1-acyl-sn-glycerol-3-phosphate acyltransferase [Firmicutes bacterium HGW-Firmicutes-8]
MLRTYFFFICFGLSLAVTGLFLPFWHVLGWLGLLNARQRYGYWVSHFWARFLLAVAGVRVKVKGTENIPQGETVLFVSNHQGNFDIPVLFRSLPKPIGFLAKVELTKIPVIHSWMNKLGCVFINRTDLRQSVKAVQKCVEVLKGGHSLVIFPEGTRARGPQMGEFKKGSLRLVEKAGVPIVPVTVNGTYRAMEANGDRITPVDVEVTVSPPIYFDRLSKEEQADINSIVREAVASKLL